MTITWRTHANDSLHQPWLSSNCCCNCSLSLLAVAISWSEERERERERERENNKKGESLGTKWRSHFRAHPIGRQCCLALLSQPSLQPVHPPAVALTRWTGLSVSLFPVQQVFKTSFTGPLSIRIWFGWTQYHLFCLKLWLAGLQLGLQWTNLLDIHCFHLGTTSG